MPSFDYRDFIGKKSIRMPSNNIINHILKIISIYHNKTPLFPHKPINSLPVTAAVGYLNSFVFTELPN